MCGFFFFAPPAYFAEVFSKKYYTRNAYCIFTGLVEKKRRKKGRSYRSSTARGLKVSLSTFQVVLLIGFRDTNFNYLCHHASLFCHQKGLKFLASSELCIAYLSLSLQRVPCVNHCLFLGLNLAKEIARMFTSECEQCMQFLLL